MHKKSPTQAALIALKLAELRPAPPAAPAAGNFPDLERWEKEIARGETVPAITADPPKPGPDC